MVRATSSHRVPSEKEAIVFLEDTARHVKIMKASWLRVAMQLQRIREEELWRFHPDGVKSFEEYAYGVLDLPRGVVRRMLEALHYTQERRPSLFEAVLDGREDVHVPSYEVVNQLRRAERTFEGRDDDFRELETRVWEDGVGRDKLRREIRERLEPQLEREHDETGETPPWDSGAGFAPQATEGPSSESEVTIESVLAELEGVAPKLLKLDVSKEARQLLFQLVELLRKESRGARAASVS